MKLSELFVSLTTVFMLCFACGTSIAAQDLKSSQSLEYELAFPILALSR
jgi:hypothetical protein